MTDSTAGPLDPLRLHLRVLRAQAGDERAFAGLFDEFGPRTLRYLTGLVGEEAEDVQQELWLTVFRSLKQLADPGAFRTWLYRTTRHRAIDRLRGMRRQQELFVEVPEDHLEDAAEAIDADPPLQPEELEGLLSGLPPPQQEVLLLRYRDDLSLGEIALIVGCPVGTVKTRIHHAKRKLRDTLTRGAP